MTLLDVAVRFHGYVRIELGTTGPRATLSVGDAGVRVELENGHTFTYPRDQVLWSPLDNRTVRMEIGDERVFFTGEEDLDFSQLAKPIPSTSRRLPVLPSIESAWIDMKPSDEIYDDDPAGRRRNSGCAHRWRDLRLAGGIYRRVCNECGEVTLDVATAQAATG